MDGLIKRPSHPAKELLTFAIALSLTLIPIGTPLSIATDNISTFYSEKNLGSNRLKILHNGRLIHDRQKKSLTLVLSNLPGLSHVVADALSLEGPPQQRGKYLLRPTTISSEWSFGFQI